MQTYPVIYCFHPIELHRVYFYLPSFLVTDHFYFVFLYFSVIRNITIPNIINMYLDTLGTILVKKIPGDEVIGLK